MLNSKKFNKFKSDLIWESNVFVEYMLVMFINKSK